MRWFDAIARHIKWLGLLLAGMVLVSGVAIARTPQGLTQLSAAMTASTEVALPRSTEELTGSSAGSVSALNPTPRDLAAYRAAMDSAHAHDRPIASGAIAQAPSQPVTSSTVTYGTVDGQPLTGYLSKPANATEPLPGLIVIQEWWGLNDHIKAMTDRLAAEGYVALAVDLYNGGVATTREEASALMGAALENPAAIDANLTAAYAYLDGTENAPKIASIGWCLGGTMSLKTALLLPDRLDAAVIYYGGILETDPAKLAPLQMPILGLFGELDQRPTPETVREFEAALNQAGKDARIHLYADADHAFSNPTGNRYNAAAAEDAWEKTTAFLAETLQ